MKKISLLLFCFFVSWAGFAQQEINTQFQDQMNIVFGNLDKNRVPHGILLDYGMEFTNVPAYNGALTDSTFSDMTSLSQIYKTLLSSRIRDVSAGFVDPDRYDTNWKDNRSSVVAIGGLYFKYAQIAADAVTANKIAVTDSVCYDQFIGGVWQNPYEEFQTFAMSPAIKKYDGFDLSVKIPAAIFYSNYQNLVQSIEIDFGNGAGYVTVRFDQNVGVSYTTEGIKIWKYKLTLTNGTQLYNQSRIKILPGLNTVPYGIPSPLGTLYSKTITATKAYAGSYGKVKLTIDLAAGHTQITKPLIVAEGFDLGVVFTPENANGMNTYATFRATVLEGGINLRNLIYNSGKQYDIIYVDWDTGVDYMQRNAYALEEVIKWVNDVKSGTEKNVVLGQSMGGVIARYALADMEQNMAQNCVDHDTRLFVSHDAPQQGANISVSIQYMYRHLTKQYLSAGTTLFGGTITIPILENNFGISNYISILDAPASRQLLSNFSTPSYTIDNTVFTSFYDELKGKGIANSGGYPVNCRNIAISNGAECGVFQEFNPGDDLLAFNWNKGLTFGGDLLSMVYVPLGGLVGGLLLDNDFFGVAFLGMLPGKSKFSVEFNAKAIPYGSGNQIYKGKITYTKKLFWFITITSSITDVQKSQPAGILPMDTYGGGFFNTNLSSQPLNINGLYKRDRFGFIPTTSALDIGKRNVVLIDSDYKKAYVGATPPVAPKNSPFANFTTDFDNTNPNTSNKQHISFDSRNGDWLALELQVNPSNPVYPNTNCSFICATNIITGFAPLCTAGTTGVYTAPLGATTYSWSITEGSNLVALSGNGTNTITLTKLNSSSGYVTMAVTLGSQLCGNATITPKRIWVGKPQFQTNDYIAGPTNAAFNQTLTYSYVGAYPSGGTSNYEWFIDAPINDGGGPTCAWQILSGQGTGSITVKAGCIAAMAVVGVKVSNSCGSNMKYTYTTISSGGGSSGGNPCNTILEIYPNPISSNTDLQIDLVLPPAPCDSNSGITINNEVEIFDFNGNSVYKNGFNTNEIIINNLDVNRGHYILNVTTAVGETIRQVIIVE